MNVWNIGEGRVERLRAYRRSPQYGAHGAVGAVWSQRLTDFEPFTSTAAVGLAAHTSYRDPQWLAKERGRRRDALEGGVLGALARLPRGRSFARTLRRLGRAGELLELRFLYDRTARALAAAAPREGSAALTADSLERAPFIADQVLATPPHAFHLASLVNTLAPYVREERLERVLEIGPAAAGFAISLRHLFGCRFVLIDLPEVLSFAFATISHYAPDSKVVLPHEVEELGDEVWLRDFVLLVPEQVSLIPDESIDLAVNTHSFQEMTYELIEGYFELVERVLRPGGLFFTENQRRFERRELGVDIEFARYPWREDFKDLLHESAPYWSALKRRERVHRLQRKPAASREPFRMTSESPPARG